MFLPSIYCVPTIGGKNMRHNAVNRTTDREREDWFAGWEEFQKLSRMLMDEDNLTQDEDDDDLELLAEPPPSYDATADDDQEDELLEKKKTKKKKPDCVRGNPEHRKDGKFAHKSKGSSWSKQPHKGSRADCKHGSRRSKGRWTKVACGRKKVDGKPDPKGNKADYRCYDAKKVREQRARQALAKLTQEEGTALVMEVVSQVVATSTLTEGRQEQLAVACKRGGFYNIEFFLELQDKLAQSQEGKLSGKE